MKLILIFSLSLLPIYVQAITIEEIIKNNGKENILAVLKSRFQHKKNKQVTVKINKKIQQQRNPNSKHISPETIQIDIDRLGITTDKLNQMLIPLKKLQERSKRMAKRYALEQRKKKQRQKQSQKRKKTVATIKEETNVNNIDPLGFVFDGWHSGITINDMKKIAWKRLLAINPGHSLPLLDEYNVQLIHSRPKERVYTYKAILFGQTASVSFYFTKHSKRLYQIIIKYLLSSRTPEAMHKIYQTTFGALFSKYGKPVITQEKIGKKRLISLKNDILTKNALVWKINAANEVLLKHNKILSTTSTYEIIYKNLPRARVNEIEKTTNSSKKIDDIPKHQDRNRL